jgi:hypothetical protein
MASPDRTDPVILGHLLGQHRELHSQLLAVRAAFAAADHPDAAGVEAIRGMLVGLREYLRRHFDQEEHGGFMEESIARMPRLSTAVTAVLADHPHLLAELDALIGGLPQGSMPRDAWPESGRRFEAFADHLLAHERDENDVVQQGYNEDLGLAD